MSTPAPRPWSTRNQMRLVGFQANEHSTEPVRKTVRARIQRRLPPTRASSQPTVGITPVNARR